MLDIDRVGGNHTAGRAKEKEQKGHDVLGRGWECVLYVLWRGGAKGSAAQVDEGQQGNAVGWLEGRKVTMLVVERDDYCV